MTKLNIADLSDEDQRVMYDQLAYKFSKAPQITAEQRAAWESINRACGKQSVQPLGPVVTSVGVARFDDAIVMLHDFITRACGLILRRPERMVLEDMALGCLADYLRALDIPVTPTTMLRQLGHLEYAVDRNYPGYAKARMLHKIAKLKRVA
jgi:hypothetical protein